MLAQLLTETIFGALTGYITNDTAIRSLFQPGGVIEKTRDDFAREAGLLLEEQVLTRAVLEQQMALPEVQQALSEILQDFLMERLPQAMAQQKLGDLPEYDEITAFLHELLLQFMEREEEQLLHLLKKYLPTEQILTEQQCEKLSTRLEQVLLDTLQQETFIGRLWNGWLAEHGEKTLEQLDLGVLCDTVMHNAAEMCGQWPQQIKQQYGEELRQLLLQTVQKIELRPVLLELDGVMAQYTLQQYLRCDETELAVLLEHALESEQGKALLAMITAQMLHALETIDMPAAEVVPEGLLKQLAPLLQQQIPVVMEQVLDWLRANSQSVNSMLESAVDEVAEELGGMKGILLEQLKETVLSQVLEQNSLVDLLQQTVINEQTTSEAAEILMQMVQQQLTEQKLGELVCKLNEKQALEKILQAFLTENLHRMMNRSGSAWMQKLLDWKPGSLHLADRQPQIETYLADIVMHGIDRIPLDGWILQCGSALKQKNIAELLHLDETQMQNIMEQAVHYGCGYLEKTLPVCSAEALYRPLYDNLQQMLKQNGQRWIHSLMSECTVETLLEAARNWMQTKQPELVAMVSKTGLDYMQGQLSRLAEDQIQQLSNEEMLKLVQDLMGRELKPLNYLGAGMGAVAGATVGTALSAALPVTAAAGPAMMASVLAGKSAVFGAVGYTTNCAAVKGLFWPYEPVGGVEMIQGVIPKQKARFAHSMGNLVDRYVINEDVLREMLQKLAPNLNHYGEKLAEQENLMQMAAAELAVNRKKLVQPMLQWLEQNGETTSHNLLEKLGGMPFAFLRSSLMDGRMLEQQMLPVAEQWLNRQLKSDTSLGQMVSGEQFWILLQQMIASAELPDFSALVYRLLQSEKKMQQIIGDGTSQKIVDAIQCHMEDWMQQKANQEKLASLAGRFISAEKLKQWLEQSSGSWVADSLSSLFGIVEQALLQLLQSRQADITVAVQSAILNRMGLMQQMGYAMMDGDTIVARVVERVLQQKLPIFLSLKSTELQALFQTCWEDTLFPAVLQVPIYQKELEYAMEMLLEQPVLHQCICRISGNAVEQFISLPVVLWGRLLRPDTLLNRMQIQLGFQWQHNGKAAVQGWEPVVLDIYKQKIGNVTLEQITRGYMETVPVRQIVQYNQLSELLRGFQLRLQENMAVTRPQHWLDWPEITAVMEQSVQKLLHEESVWQWMQYEAEFLVLQLAEQWERLLPPDTRKVLITPALQAVFATAETHGTQLLGAMNLAHLAEEQLIAMDSAHLERVVRGFAGHYLVHIENRGWMGAVFALPGMLIYLF